MANSFFAARPLRRVAAVSTLVVVIVTTAAVSIARPHDSRLDDADAALEKAQVLLDAVVCVSEIDKGTKECQKAVDRAIEHIAAARAEVAAAAAADAVPQRSLR